MTQRNTLLIIFCTLFGCLIYSCKDKNNQSNFKIEGVINADSGRVSLVFHSDYMPTETKEMTAVVKDKKFLISGYIPESQGVFLVYDGENGGEYMSSNFVIEKGMLKISINIDSSRTLPLVENKVMLEDYPKYRTFRKDLVTKYDVFDQKGNSLREKYGNDIPDSIGLSRSSELKMLHTDSDRNLLKYTQENPNSQIAFWHLIRLIDWGYEPICDSIYDSFSENLKNGYVGKILKEKLQISKQFAVGSMFTFFDCENLNSTGEKLSQDVFQKNKYTLVDFWYSGCGPCRRQFGHLRDLYEKYNNAGFEIIGISVDQVKDKEELENLIVKDKLVWKQYWDKDGVEAQKNLINVFPTNFLIDNTGKIIQKHISMEELSEFLRVNVPLQDK